MKPQQTDQQRKNLAIHTLFCHENRKRIVGHFDMRVFQIQAGPQEPLFGYRDTEVSLIDMNQCGTAACFCGWAPHAGILPKDKENWQRYSERCFTEDEELWEWLFDDHHPNSIDSAIKRAAWVLQGGEIHAFDDPQDVEDTIHYFEPDWELIRKIANT